MADIRKCRRPRFTDAELIALVEEVERRAEVITGKLDPGLTCDQKNKAWGEVADAVNAISNVPRSQQEVRRRYRDLRSHVKCKAAAEQRHIAGSWYAGAQ